MGDQVDNVVQKIRNQVNSLKCAFVLLVRFALRRDPPPFTVSYAPPIRKFVLVLIESIWFCFFAQDFHIFSKPHVSNFGEVPTTERRVLFSEWLGKAHEKLSSELIQKVFKKTGCCLDMTGKENERVDIDQVQTFEVPKLGDQKMKKLSEDEIVEWEKRETDLRTSAVLANLE